MKQPAFSLRRVGAIAANTFTELTRLRVFYVLLLFALVLIASSIFMARLTFQQEFQVLKDISLGAITIFTSILAIAATARLLPHDVEDRTVYTILAKPVPRFEYVTGKLLGVLLLLLVTTAVMAALFFAVLYVREQSALAETARQMAGAPPDQLADAVRGVREAAFNGPLLAAVAMIFLKAAVLASLTLFISTFASSTVFSIVVSVFVYVIGHLQGTAREFWLQEQGAGWLTRVFLAFVALVFPDLHLFDFSDQVVAGAAIPTALFVQSSTLGFFYILIYLLLAVAVFTGKEL
ncbi:MAG TPA: ABC transporter permease subunit, partial [Chthoniobacterales bacterium]